jgi:hypothetical protein
MMNQRDPFSKLFITVNAGKPQKMSNFFVFVSKRVSPEFLGAKIATEMFFVV